MEGWIKLHRRAMNHWLYTENRKHTRREAWEDILMLCNHEDSKVLLNGELIDCKRGQSVRSVGSWAKLFNWSDQNVRSFFKLLEKDDMIEVEGLRKTTRLTVCNYDVYQSMSTGKQQTSSIQVTTNKNEKNFKNEKNEYSATTIPPDICWVEDVFRNELKENNLAYNPKDMAEKFMNFYESKGWIISRGVKMNDWIASIKGSWIPDLKEKQSANKTKYNPEPPKFKKTWK